MSPRTNPVAPGRLAVSLLLSVCFAVTQACPSAKVATPQSEPPTLALQAARLLDVRLGQWIESPVVLVREDRIAAVGTAGDLEIPEGVEVVTLPDLSLLPGLIDAHVHLAWRSEEESPEVLPGAEEARKTLLAGFTTVRNLGATGDTDFALREAIERGEIPGPRMLLAGPGLGAEGGVCDQVFEGEGRVQDAEEARRRVTELAERGADWIKLCAGGGVLPAAEDAGTVELTPEVMRAIVDEAHQRALPVAAHAQTAEAIRRAVEAGVDSIEHGAFLDRETADRMAERGVYLVPTLARFDLLAEQAQRDQGRALASQQTALRERMRAAVTAGVPIVLGTDATVLPHGWNARELVSLEAVGLSPLEAVRAATVRAAELLGWEDRVGAVEPGLYADVIGVAGNPLQDLEVLQDVRFVLRGGELVHHPED